SRLRREESRTGDAAGTDRSRPRGFPPARQYSRPRSERHGAGARESRRLPLGRLAPLRRFGPLAIWRAMHNQKNEPIHVIGGGLAGSEAAWQAAEAGAKVILHEMRPVQQTDAHQTENFAELVCSNSFRSDDWQHNAVGLLHEEMRRCNSLIMRAADAHKLP